MTRADSVARAERLGFAPTPGDNTELGLYFSAGPNPPRRWTSPEQRLRRERVERALDGRGYALQRYYTGQLFADDPDLAREHEDFARRFHARGRPPNATPHIVLTDLEVERLLTRQVPAARPIVWDGRGWSQPEHQAYADWLGDLADLKLRGLIEHHTWGAWRVSPEGARELVRASLWLDSEVTRASLRRLSDDAALERVRARLAELPAPPVEETHEDAGLPIQVGRWARAEMFADAREGGYLPIDPSTRWVERPDRDPEWTTVTELADRHLVQREWVRQALARLGCPGVANARKHSRLPTSWFATSAGHEFWRDLIAEAQQRRAEIRKSSKRNRYTDSATSAQRVGI